MSTIWTFVLLHIVKIPKQWAFLFSKSISPSLMTLNIIDFFVFKTFSAGLFYRLQFNRLLRSFQLYIVKFKKRPTKHWCLTQHGLKSFNQCFAVLTQNSFNNCRHSQPLSLQDSWLIQPAYQLWCNYNTSNQWLQQSHATYFINHRCRGQGMEMGVG